jgi:hypothetical protein
MMPKKLLTSPEKPDNIPLTVGHGSMAPTIFRKPRSASQSVTSHGSGEEPDDMASSASHKKEDFRKTAAGAACCRGPVCAMRQT